jgi:transcriptional regulator GlxA family with amidase domain
MDEKLKSPPKIDVYFVLLPGSLILDWAGPAEAIRIANQLLTRQGGVPRFELHFICPSNAAESSVGVMLSGLSPLPHGTGRHQLDRFTRTGRKHHRCVASRCSSCVAVAAWIAFARRQAGVSEFLCVRRDCLPTLLGKRISS